MSLPPELDAIARRARSDSRYSASDTAAYLNWLAAWPDPTSPDYQRVEIPYADGSYTSLLMRSMQKEHKIRAKRRTYEKVELLKL
jgi:hypothetical protein